MNSHKKGFTLIELLVVISIIGLLSSIVLASLNGAKTKATDSARFQEVKQLVNALFLYKLDHGQFPGGDSGPVVFTWVGQCSGVCLFSNPNSSPTNNQFNDATFSNALRPYFSAVDLPVNQKIMSIDVYKSNIAISYDRFLYRGNYIVNIYWANESGVSYCPNPPSAEADSVAVYMETDWKNTLCEMDLVDN